MSKQSSKSTSRYQINQSLNQAITSYVSREKSSKDLSRLDPGPDISCAWGHRKDINTRTHFPNPFHGRTIAIVSPYQNPLSPPRPLFSLLYPSPANKAPVPFPFVPLLHLQPPPRPCSSARQPSSSNKERKASRRPQTVHTELPERRRDKTTFFGPSICFSQGTLSPPRSLQNGNTVPYILYPHRERTPGASDHMWRCSLLPSEAALKTPSILTERGPKQRERRATCK